MRENLIANYNRNRTDRIKWYVRENLTTRIGLLCLMRENFAARKYLFTVSYFILCMYVLLELYTPISFTAPF